MSDPSLSSGRTSEARSLPAPLARWNPSRDCWETEEVDLLSGLSAVWSETWPTSGMWADGLVYASPTWADATGGSASSLSHGLPTPTVADSERSSPTYGRGNPTLLGALLPTPTVSESTGPGTHGTGGLDLRTAVALLTL